MVESAQGSIEKVRFLGYEVPLLHLQLVILVACCILVNLNLLSNGFVWDDYFQVVNNQKITHVRYLPDLFSTDVFSAQNGQSSNYYRPGMYLIYMATRALFGLQPWAFHLVNILLHAGVTALVFLCGSHLLRGMNAEPVHPVLSAPFLAAQIFAVHPVHAEAVAWIACIPELSFSFLGLLCLYCHLSSPANYDRRHLLSVLCFGLALFCKEPTVTLLLVLPLYDYLFRRQEMDPKRVAGRYAPFVLPLAVYLALRFNALGGVAPARHHQDLGPFDLLLNIVVLFGGYLQKLVLPIGLNAAYIFHPVRSPADPAFLLSLAALLLFSGSSFVLYRRNRPAFFGLSLILVPLLPVFYIPGFSETVFAERYLYLPSAGFVLFLGALLATRPAHRPGIQKGALAALLAVGVLFGAGTLSRNAVWRDDLALWSDTIVKSPDGLIPLQGIGIAAYEKGDLATAERHLATVCARPDVTNKSLKALAGIYLSTEREGSSVPLLQRALERTPENPELLLMLSNAYRSTGQLALAQEYLQKVSALFPGFDQILMQRVMELCRDGERLMSEQRTGEAEVRFREAYLMKPDFAPTLIDLGGLHATKGDSGKAIQLFSRAAELDRGNPAPHYNLAMLYESLGKAQEARAEMGRYQELDARAKQAGNNQH